MNKYYNRYEKNEINKPYEWYLNWLRKKGFTKK